MPDRRLVQSLSPDAVLDLQRGAGNRSVAQLFSGLGNAEAARLMPKRVPGFQPPGKQDSEPDEEAEEKKAPGLGDVVPILSSVNKAISAVMALDKVFDDLFKSKMTETSATLAPMASKQVEHQLNRALHYETSRLVCEYVFEKG